METPKKKRRYSDKRRQMSRDAARFRRSNEARIFAELHSVLPCTNVPPQLDKASIVRIIIAYLKLHRVVSDVLDISDRPVSLTALDYKFDHLYLKALDGFVMVITKDGEVIYISENVDSYLGLLQVDIVGHSIFDLTHPCDHDDVHDLISDKWRHHAGLAAGSDVELRPHCELFIRMKSSLVSKGHFPTFKSSAYRVVHCCGHSVPVTDGLGVSCVLLTGRLIPHPSFVDVQLDTQSFVSWHNMDMSFTYCDERVCKLLGFNAHDLIGKSLYHYHHVQDGDMLEKAYKTLFSKGQMVTGPYRFLASWGGYAWLETQATIVTKSTSDKTQCVVCISSVISDVEEQDLILSDVQLPTKREVADEPMRTTLATTSHIVIEPHFSRKLANDEPESKCKKVKSEKDLEREVVDVVTVEDEEQLVIEDGEYEEEVIHEMKEDSEVEDDGDDDKNEDDDGDDDCSGVTGDSSVLPMDPSKMMFATEMIVKKFSRTISLACLTSEETAAHIHEASLHAPAADFHSSLLEKLGKLQCVSSQHSCDSDTMTSSSSQDLHTIPSNNSLFTLLENLQQNEFEQRAPYIPPEDMFFGDEHEDIATTCSTSDNMTSMSSTSSGVFFTSGDPDDSYIDSSTGSTTPTNASQTPLGCATPLKSCAAGHTPLYYAPAVMAARGQNTSQPASAAASFWHADGNTLLAGIADSTTAAGSGGGNSGGRAPNNCSSILMNLLVTGRDVNFGYQLDNSLGDGTGPVPSELYQMLCSK